MILQRKTTPGNDDAADRFSEELYFMLMSSTLRPRILTLAAKHGLSPRQLHRTLTRPQQNLQNHR